MFIPLTGCSHKGERGAIRQDAVRSRHAPIPGERRAAGPMGRETRDGVRIIVTTTKMFSALTEELFLSRPRTPPWVSPEGACCAAYCRYRRRSAGFRTLGEGLA